MRWTFLVKPLILMAMLPAYGAAAANSDANAALESVRNLNEKVRGFRADLEAHDKQEGEEQVTSSALIVSKAYGWKIKTAAAQGSYEFVCDFKNFYQYFPAEKKVFKNSASSPDAEAMFRKPVTDLNPIALVDASTIQFHGKTEFEGQPVYHFEGTTSTRFIPQGDPVTRRMEVWVSTIDGLPRKTIESIGPAQVMTVFRNVELNPDLKPSDFQFTPPPGIAVVDADQEIKEMEEQAKRAESVQSRKSAFTSMTSEITSPPLQTIRR